MTIELAGGVQERLEQGMRELKRGEGVERPDFTRLEGLAPEIAATALQDDSLTPQLLTEE